jgi:transcriptional regulatory protein RtcR
VQEEIERLGASWARPQTEESDEILSRLLSEKALGGIDLFDRAQLAEVAQICRNSRSMSEAGRRLFGASRIRKTSSNDADRLRKYLSRFGIEWDQIIQLGS